MHKIEIKQDKLVQGTYIYIDDQEIKGVKSINYNIAVDEFPEVTLGIMPQECNIESTGIVGLVVYIDSIEDAMSCIQLEMKLNKEFRKAMIASVASILVERGEDYGTSLLIAERIINRIFDME